MANRPLPVLVFSGDQAELHWTIDEMVCIAIADADGRTQRHLVLMQATGHLSAADGLNWICAADRTVIPILRRPMPNLHLDYIMLSPSGTAWTRQVLLIDSIRRELLIFGRAGAPNLIAFQPYVAAS